MPMHQRLVRSVGFFVPDLRHLQLFRTDDPELGNGYLGRIRRSNGPRRFDGTRGIAVRSF